MTSQEQVEEERRTALERLRTAAESLQPTARTRLFGVTQRMLDRAYEKAKADIEETYESRMVSTSGGSPGPSGSVPVPGNSKDSGSVLATEQVAEVVAEYRRDGKRIIFTNGCFDLLHRGHVAYLAEAKRLGDILILGLNSDDSVRRLKGNGRPVLLVQDRAEILIALRSVDHVVVFDEDTAENLVDLVRPDVYVKGGDYNSEFPTPEAKRAARYGAEFQVLSYVESASTSQLIDRIIQIQH